MPGKRALAEADSTTLAAHYRNAVLGTVSTERRAGHVFITIRNLRSEAASRKNDDGSVSFITITPTMQGAEFVVGPPAPVRSLIIRDAQHEYVFNEE